MFNKKISYLFFTLVLCTMANGAPSGGYQKHPHKIGGSGGQKNLMNQLTSPKVDAVIASSPKPPSSSRDKLKLPKATKLPPSKNVSKDGVPIVQPSKRPQQTTTNPSSFGNELKKGH